MRRLSASHRYSIAEGGSVKAENKLTVRRRQNKATGCQIGNLLL
jgi:hypothetical protein